MTVEAEPGRAGATGAAFNFRNDVFEGLNSTAPDYEIVVSMSMVDSKRFAAEHRSRQVW